MVRKKSGKRGANEVKMFNKILIANRGEIACRVIKTARRMGIKTVAVYSDADSNAMHVQMADEAIYIGASPSRESYLVIDKIINAARQTGAQAIHPGYGFLSENAEFCRACEKNKLVFIGPPIGAIEAMGSKSAAKQIMEKAKVPLVPGYHGEKQDEAFLKKCADEMGYPVLLKAAAGGGGKGMRQVWAAKEFSEALAAAKREAISSFNDDIMLVEKYLTAPRHVEIQVFCDSHDNAVYLHERDCSVQRRHQKVIEEAPAPGMTPELRASMGEAAIKAARAINYCGAGTVEFLLDEDGSFYFMEMNTRLQVEHPVTEMITDQDLVEWQVKVAAGEKLPLSQEQIPLNGHAFEARIYAEDPDNDFLPATGVLNYLQPPVENTNVRVDTGVRQGDEVSPFYDPMIAKLVVWDENREKALARLASALIDYRISGVTTNVDFLYNLATAKSFRQAELDTGFIEKHHAQIFRDDERELAQDVPLAALAILARRKQYSINDSKDAWSPWSQADAWRLNQAHRHRIEFKVQTPDGERLIQTNIDEAGNNNYRVSSEFGEVSATAELQDDLMTVVIDGHKSQFSVFGHKGEYSIYTEAGAFHFVEVRPDFGEADEAGEEGSLQAPMNGTMVALLVEPGSKVEKDAPLLVMEAMKMEHNVRAPADGVVRQFFYKVGDLVEAGAELVEFEQAES